MKFFVLGLLLAVASGTFVDFLVSIQSHHSFQRLPEGDKLLFGQLVVAAENNELTEFIDRVGLVPVLKMMDHMSSYDAEKFAAYLAEHSNYTHHAPDHGDVINKRSEDLAKRAHDHHDSLHDYMMGLHSPYYQHLPEQEKQTFNGLVQAAANKQLTAYLATIGYGPVFGLLEHLDDNHAFEVHQLIENALTAEAASTGPVKRQFSHHHSDFYDYLQNLNSQYYEHLPEEERQIYHDLTSAAQAHNLTDYIHTHGYGPIFGFLEHLDRFHADQAYKYLTNALTAEAEAAAAGN